MIKLCGIIPIKNSLSHELHIRPTAGKYTQKSIHAPQIIVFIFSKMPIWQLNPSSVYVSVLASVAAVLPSLWRAGYG